jgi:hypothetical protein
LNRQGKPHPDRSSGERHVLLPARTGKPYLDMRFELTTSDLVTGREIRLPVGNRRSRPPQGNQLIGQKITYFLMVISRNLNSNFRFQIRSVTTVTGNPDPPQDFFFYREPKSCSQPNIANSQALRRWSHRRARPRPAGNSAMAPLFYVGACANLLAVWD